MRRKTVTSISRCRTLHPCHKFDTCTLFPDSPRRNIIFMYVKYVLVSTRTWDQKAENRAIPFHPFLYHLIHKTLNKKTPPPQNKNPPSKTPRKKCKMLMSFLHGGNRKSQKKKNRTQKSLARMISQKFPIITTAASTQTQQQPPWPARSPARQSRRWRPGRSTRGCR